MEFSQNLKTALAMLAVVALAALVYGIPLAIRSMEPETCTINGECQHELFAEQVINFLPLAFLLGIAAGAAAYFFFSERRSAQHRPPSRDAVLMLLGPEERKVFSKIVENGGKALQSEVSYLEGVGKVKAHRLIQRMERKGIVVKEGMGKTNMVKLPKELQELFF